MLKRLTSSCVFLAILSLAASTAALSSSSHLYSYINNPNVTRLEKLIDDPTSPPEEIARAALLSGYAITYGFATSDGGAQKFNDFANTCYDKAFSTEQMKSILGCFIVVDVVVTRIESATTAKVRKYFDEMIDRKLQDSGITDPTIKAQILTDFSRTTEQQIAWISTLTVRQFVDCIERGEGKQCGY